MQKLHHACKIADVELEHLPQSLCVKSSLRPTRGAKFMLMCWNRKDKVKRML